MSQGTPPAGGFGGQSYGGARAGPMTPPPARSGGGMSLVIVIILVVVGVLVVGGGIMAVLAIYGTRKYIANAKTAEARNSLGMMAKDAVAAYEGEELTGTTGTTTTRSLCRSATQPIPRDIGTVSGRKYQSSAAEWQVDAARPHTGFACLKFEMYAPQYYQYDYQATATTFTGRARGDLNGDGVPSTFEVQGQVSGGRLMVAPSISETSPDE